MTYASCEAEITTAHKQIYDLTFPGQHADRFLRLGDVVGPVEEHPRSDQRHPRLDLGDFFLLHVFVLIEGLLQVLDLAQDFQACVQRAEELGATMGICRDS